MIDGAAPRLVRSDGASPGALRSAALTMAHVPHLYLPPPWGERHVALTTEARHHLERVLRRTPGTTVTYTDGLGTVGKGVLADGVVGRGPETTVPRDALLTCVVAPPQRTERVRFVIEKLAELGIDRLSWLRSRHAGGAIPRPDKAAAWAAAALEQSRGAHLMHIGGPVAWGDLGDARSIVVATPGGRRAADVLPSRGDVTIVVGPEGGFAEEEIPADARRLGLGDRILRTETAAVVAASLALEQRRSVR